MTPVEEFAQLLTRDLDVALAGLELPQPEPSTGRCRIAAHIGQAGWEVGNAVFSTGRRIDRALVEVGARIIEGGDWLAARVAGR